MFRCSPYRKPVMRNQPARCSKNLPCRVLVSACATAAGSAPAAGSGSPSSFPVGVYTVVIQRAEITDATLTSSAGSWRFSFSDTGVFEAAKNNVSVSTGSYTSSGDHVTVTFNTGGCQGMGDGTYTWTRSGTTLTLAPVRDTCRPRRLILTLKPLARL